MGSNVSPVDLEQLLAERWRLHGAYLVPHGEFDFSSVDMTWVAGTAFGQVPTPDTRTTS
jgi:hypothetical protein